MTTFSGFKPIAGLVISAYLALICVPKTWAAPEAAAGQLFAQERGLVLEDPNAPKQPKTPRTTLSDEELKAP